MMPNFPKSIPRVISTILLGCSIGALAQMQPTLAGLIPLDPGAQGYKVDNTELRFKEQLALPRNISLRRGGWLDARFWLANLIADEAGSYELDRVKKIVLVDSQTGEIQATRYGGNLLCFADGNVATLVNRGKPEDRVFSFGRYGGDLQTWIGGIPNGKYLNAISCSLEPLKPKGPTLIEGRRVTDSSTLRRDHGFLMIVGGNPLPANTKNLPSELQRLLQQPFMQNMSLASPFEDWYLMKPDGTVIAIPNNPGEAAGMYARITYLPYLDAYFLPPYVGGRPFDPEELRSVPKFARLLHPDGRVELFGVPDVIWDAYQRKEAVFNTYHAKRGLIWVVAVTSKTYAGPLTSATYLDDRATKTLKRLPTLSFGNGSPTDGCTVGTRTEVTQRRPHLLFDMYYINLCTGEQK